MESMDNSDERIAGQVKELVAANHVLFARGVVDGFGHVSVRHAIDPARFLLSRSMAPALVASGDILTYDLEGREVRDDTRPSYIERFIHSEIYRARPDVMAVVHSHSPAVIPFSVVKSATIRPVYHLAGFLGESTPVYEIREDAGDSTDLLIRDSRLGAALSRCLKQHVAVLLRGHGSTVVGENLRQAVFRAVYLEMNARIQADALQLGEVTYLTAEEAAAAAITNDRQMDRAWDLWLREAERHRSICT
jgi:ribulose-5-phosphate 4-epimerase/fuculose-1-phosphate aldolase